MNIKLLCSLLHHSNSMGQQKIYINTSKSRQNDNINLKLIWLAKNAQTKIVRCCFDVATAGNRYFVIYHYEMCLMCDIEFEWNCPFTMYALLTVIEKTSWEAKHCSEWKVKSKIFRFHHYFSQVHFPHTFQIWMKYSTLYFSICHVDRFGWLVNW